MMIIKNLIILSLLCYGIAEALADPMDDLMNSANEIIEKPSQNEQKSKIKSRDFQPKFNNIVDSFKKPLNGKPFENIQIVPGHKKAKQFQKQSKYDNFQNDSNENQIITTIRNILIMLRNFLGTAFSRIFLFLMDFAKKLLKSFNTNTFDFDFFN